jgi:hypothetical protein
MLGGSMDEGFDSSTKKCNLLTQLFDAMQFTTLVPSIFYADINDALRLFVDCLEFQIQHEELKSDKPFCVIGRNGLKIYLFQDAMLAAEHHPELRLETNNINEVFEKVSATHPQFLHPNLSRVTLRPWGAKEFAVMDNQLGVRIQEW